MYVIMPCFNTEKEIHDLTEMAVESIRNAGNVKLIIVDNGSTYAVKALKNLADIYIRNEIISYQRIRRNQRRYYIKPKRQRQRNAMCS